MSLMDTQSSTKSLNEHKHCVGDAAADMFRSVCGIELELKEDTGQLTNDGIIIAIISLVGDVEWSIFLGLPRETAPVLAEKFAGMEIPFESDDMGDAVGELANILAGDVKRKLDAKGVKVDISLPSVFRAESLEVLVQSGADSVRELYDSSVGTLWTGIAVQKQVGLAV